jgi:dTDP-glucose pyrophosphorylase
MTNREFQGVILAAGRGNRMAPFSEHYPKPILPVCNKPVIQYQIETMHGLGIRDIVVLIGHKGFELSKVLGNGSRFGVSIRYVEQSSTLGIAHAVGCLEPYLDRPFLLFLGDIFFVPGDLGGLFDLFRQQSGGAVLGTKEEQNPEAIRRNFSMTVDAEGFVTRVVEKPRHATNRLKGVGIYLFDLTVFDAIRRTPRTAMRDEYEITDSIQVMIQDGLPVRPCNCVVDDINLTTPADLLYCNLILARSAPNGIVIGSNSSLHEGVHIESSVIGQNVTVRNAISIRNSVVFDETDVRSETGFDNFILTPTGMVDCNYGIQNGRNLWINNSRAYA